MTESYLPKISVIVPVLNGEKYLAEALKSLLSQRYETLEILVVDDGSTDGTRKVAEAFQGKIRYVFQENKGAPSARNRGVSLATGDLIGFLDADDLWVPGRLKKDLLHFEEDPDLEILMGRLQRFQVYKEEKVFLNESWIAPSLGACLLKRSAFLKTGFFDEGSLACDDVDWLMRSQEKDVKLKVSEDIVLYYRRHDHNMTNDVSKNNHFLLHVVKRSIDRKRKNPQKKTPSLSSFSKKTHFFNTLSEAYQEAVRVRGVESHFFKVGDFIFRLLFAGEALVPHLTPALEHLRVPEAPPQTEGKSLTLHLFDTASTGIPLQDLPWKKTLPHTENERWVYQDEERRAIFQEGEKSLQALYPKTGEAFFWVPDANEIPYWVTGAPLYILFHWFLGDRGMKLIHGGAISGEKGAVLLVGKGGSGKSTSVLSCLGSDLRYLSDDYCLLSSEEPPTVFSLYNSAKVTTKDIDKFPELIPGFRRRPDIISPDKTLFLLHRHAPSVLQKEAPLRAIFLPKITGSEKTTLVPLSPAKALLGLAPSTLFQLPGSEGEAFQLMASLVKKIPTFELRVGTNLQDIPKVISAFLKEDA